VKDQLKKTHESLRRAEIERAQDQKNYMDALAKLKKTSEETQLFLDTAYQEKKELFLQLTQEKLAHQDTRKELFILQRNLDNSEAYKEVVKSYEAQRDGLLQQLAESRAEQEE